MTDTVNPLIEANRIARQKLPLLIERSREAREFADRLLTQQEPLGKEFEEVLYENLWGLYERE